MVHVKVFTFNLFAENTIVLWDEQTRETAVVDPGVSTEGEQKILSNFISTEKLSVRFLINTHCHIDHIFGCSFIKQKYNPVYYAPEKDIPLLENAKTQASMFDIDFENPPKPDMMITEETKIQLGNSIIQFLFTPGHTPGEYCLYFKDEKICITGDVLFKEGIGRTDLWGGDYKTLISSIETKLLTLPDEVVIFPGHGESSTIGYEKQNNPFLA